MAPAFARITDEEAALVRELRDRVRAGPDAAFLPNELDKDSYFVRFLRVRDHDVARASAMVEASLAWRRRRDVNGYESWGIPNVAESRYYYPKYFHRTCNDGQVVFYDRSGRLRLREIHELGTVDGLIQFYIQLNEYLWRHDLCKDPREVRKMTTVIDMDGMSWATVTHSSVVYYFRSICEIGCDHYPEATSRAVIINTPFFFPWMWAVLSPWLPAKTRDNTLVPSRSKQLGVLLQYIPEEHLPADMGGRCECRRAGCEMGCDIEQRFLAAIGEDPAHCSPGHLPDADAPTPGYAWYTREYPFTAPRPGGARAAAAVVPGGGGDVAPGSGFRRLCARVVDYFRRGHAARMGPRPPPGPVEAARQRIGRELRCGA